MFQVLPIILFFVIIFFASSSGMMNSQNPSTRKKWLIFGWCIPIALIAILMLIRVNYVTH